MTEISATAAARNFAELLDAVEFKGQRITIVRRGRAIAHIEPVTNGHGKEVKTLLKRNSADAAWKSSLKKTRDLVVAEDRF
jgi:prevent-host-death family protein